MSEKQNKLSVFWKNNRGIIVFLFLMLFFRTAVADWYHVPTGSMQPNIMIGDRVWVNKLAYDVKIPFTDINLNHHSSPVPGDVVVFNSAVSNERLIKRVIGVPGDTVSMVSNRIKINDDWLDYETIPKDDVKLVSATGKSDSQFLLESIEQDNSRQSSRKKYPIKLRANQYGSNGNFRQVSIPDGYYLVLGDNRDNSQDSRFIGLVPETELVGKAEKVIISFDKDNYYLPRESRFFETL